MFLRKGSTYFSLHIKGYEFQHASEKDDANWLIILIKACDDKQTWSANNSCLRTFELLDLKAWFEDILKNPLESKSISFTENELAFIYENMLLTVVLDFDFHPKRGNYDYDVDEEYHLNFDVDNSTLLKIIDFLSDTTRQYPVRS